jgi:hypothetical protein
VPSTHTAADAEAQFIGETWNVLFDTGAYGGIMSASKYSRIAKRFPIVSQPRLVEGVTSKPLCSLGSTIIHFSVSGVEFKYEFTILPCKTKTIVGLDFMRKHKALWDFEQDILYLRDPMVSIPFTPVKTERKVKKTAGLYTTHKRVIPALSTTLVDVNTGSSQKYTQFQVHGLIAPVPDLKSTANLQVGRGIQILCNAYTVIAVQNETLKPITLAEGTQLAEFAPVDRKDWELKQVPSENETRATYFNVEQKCHEKSTEIY